MKDPSEKMGWGWEGITFPVVIKNCILFKQKFTKKKEKKNCLLLSFHIPVSE